MVVEIGPLEVFKAAQLTKRIAALRIKNDLDSNDFIK
jgi:hypothetical protein